MARPAVRPVDETLIAQAQLAVDLVQDEPQRARAMATGIVSVARRNRDEAALAVAERALGQVATVLEELASANRHLRSSIRHAIAARDPLLEAQSRMSIGLVLAQLGRYSAALRELDAAEPVLRGRDRGRLLNQRGVVLISQGRNTKALEHLTEALAISRRTADRLNEIRVLSNRGVAQTSIGKYASAARDLRTAGEVADRAGQGLMAASIRQNLGWLAGRQGDVPKALDYFDQAETHFRPHCEALGTLLLDRCQVLMSACLLGEAADAAQQALDAFTEGNVQSGIAEAHLAVAEVALLRADAVLARSAADAAVARFVRQRRAAWAALALYARLRADVLESVGEPGAQRRSALRVAELLRVAGLNEAALDARIVAARLALVTGRLRPARRELATAASARHLGTVELRTRAWHAEALLHVANGDRVRARAALTRGLRILEEHRALLGATDLRAAASTHRIAIAQLGFELALADHRPAEALRWVERSRAGLLRVRATRPPEDAQLAALLAALRATIGDLEEAARSGEPVAPLRARQAALERQVRDRSRTLGAGSTELPAAPPPLSALAERLADRVLLEYVAHRERLFALMLVDGRVHVEELGPIAPIADEIRTLNFYLDRVAQNWSAASSRASARELVRRSGARLDELLLMPLLPRIGQRPLVLVPTGAIQSVPWSRIPSCVGRPLAVVPSGTVWYEADARAVNPSESAVLIAGPGLDHGDDEVRSIAQLYPTARVLLGAQASVADNLTALDGAQVAHIAAHGRYRADNPLFSSLRMGDGPMTVYDLESMSRAPSLVVLSACDSARADVRPGDELLGLGAAFLSLGTKVLIASLVSVPDEDARDAMVDLHGRLRRGQPASVALADIQAEWLDDPDGSAAAGGLICLGAG